MSTRVIAVERGVLPSELELREGDRLVDFCEARSIPYTNRLFDGRWCIVVLDTPRTRKALEEFEEDL